MRARVLSFRYVGALLAIAGLLAAGQVVVQHALEAQEGDARAINLAGRQRMLGQRLCMLLLALGVEDRVRAPDTVAELVRTSDDWERNHAALRAGHAGIVPSAEVRALFDRIDGDHRAMLAAARTAAAASLLAAVDPVHARTARAHQDAFLAGMDAIVAAYEREARRRVDDLRILEFGLLGLALGVLVLEGAFVFRPAVAGLRAYLAQRDLAEAALEASEAEKRAILRAFPDRLIVRARDGGCVELGGGALPRAVEPSDAHGAEGLDPRARGRADDHGSDEPAEESRARAGGDDHRAERPPTGDEGVLDGDGAIASAGEHLDERPRPLAQLVPVELAEACEERAERVLETGEAARVEVRTEGGAHEVRLSRFAPDRLLIVIRDLSATARLEHQVLQASDREQARLAQDLHDGLTQDLIGIAFVVASLRRSLAGGAHAPVVEELTALVAEAIDRARRVTRGLHEPALEVTGLAAALGELAAHTQRVYGVACRVRDRTASYEPTGERRAQLHRIAREAVVNAAKHARATTIEIELDLPRGAGELTLVVRDDGIGIGPRPAVGMGLHLMEYRARSVGGSLQVAARDPRGTTVTCRVPVGGLAAAPELAG